MKFRTELNLSPSPFPLDPEKPVVLLGSCFTQSIGSRMRNSMWDARPNICGVLYNPLSIADTLERAISFDTAAPMLADSITSRDGLFMSWLTDSSATTYSHAETLHRLNHSFHSLHDSLTAAQALIVTFGTAWVYELASEPGHTVANCHKFPASTFLRRRLTVSEITERWQHTANLLRSLAPDIRIILTVSPIRHLKDGFEGNCRSKAILQLACEELCATLPDAEYFPSYEILTDDLRDYRFYASDLVHPSDEAVDYIWQKFTDRYLTPESRNLLAQGERITRALAHRPLIQSDCDTARLQAARYRAEALRRHDEFLRLHPGMLPSQP